MLKSFIQAKKIIEIIEQHGYTAYIVGGAVRDYLLGRKIGDIDIASSAKPEQIQQIFDKVIPVGIEHGTVIVRFEGESYEVTTFRTEGLYSDHRHPDNVKFIDKIEKDLARRDFTINAIALDKHGNYVDPFNGRDDLNRHMIRTVGNPEERFKEDPLRMLRALRFASQLGFDIETYTFTVLSYYVDYIERIAIERVATEVEKMFAGAYISSTTKLFIHSNMPNYLPILKDNTKIKKQIGQLKHPLHSFSEVIALSHYYENTISIDKWVKDWKLSNQTRKDAHQLFQAITNYKENKLTPWLVYRLPNHLDKALIRLLTILFSNSSIAQISLNELRENLPITARNQMAINGNDITHLFPNRQEGPWINQLLTKLEFAIVNGKVKNIRKDLEGLLKEWNPPEIN